MLSHINLFDEIAGSWAKWFKVPDACAKALWRIESGGNRYAVSSAGAIGLFQIMPETARISLPEKHEPFLGLDEIKVLLQNVHVNAMIAMKYFRFCLDFWPEIQDEDEATRFALASWNGGPGNISKAAAKARRSLGQPESYQEWASEGCHPGAWQKWEYTSRYLGRDTDAEQIRQFVDKVEARSVVLGGHPF